MSGMEAIGIGGFGLTIIGFMWKMSNDMRALSENSENGIKKANEIQDEKRARVYTRIDEVKDHSECTFVRKDVCTVMHQAVIDQMEMGFKSLKTDIEGLKDKVDMLIVNKNG